MSWSWDPLGLAASVADYVCGHAEPRVDVIEFDFTIGPHPCDDEPYIGAVSVLSINGLAP